MKGWGRLKICRILFESALLLCAVVSLTVNSSIAAPPSPLQKRVLLLYDSRSDMLGNIVVDRTIRSVLMDAFDVNLDIRSEYFEQSDQPEHDAVLLKWLSTRYAGTKFDVVVAVGAGALGFVSGDGRELFRGAQPVFWGRKDYVKSWQSDAPLTGVVAPDMERSVTESADFIAKLQPDLRRLIVVAGASIVDRRWEVAARAALLHENRFEVSYLIAPTLEDLQLRLAGVSKHSAVLFLTLNEDGAGRRLLKFDVLRRVAQAASAPVYSTSVIHLDTGIVGGVLVNQETLATETAILVERLLRGGRVQDIPIQEGSLTPTVNWTQLRRWKIALNQIPPGTVIINRTPSAWELYKWPIVGALSLCALEAILIVALLIHRTRRKRAERSLCESRRLLQSTLVEIKQAHADQQRLTGLLLRAQDDERRRIARDLHDVTVQNMVGIKAVMNRVQRVSSGMDAKILDRLGEGATLCDQVIKELRTLSYVLHPPLLDELGLVPALQWFVRGFIERSGIHVELVVKGSAGRFEPDVESALFRVAQESLSNIRRHSGSFSAQICFTQENDAVILEISDRGRGICADAPGNSSQAPPGVGINGMTERLKQLGGQLEVESGEQGTLVRARAPIRGAALCQLS